MHDVMQKIFIKDTWLEFLVYYPTNFILFLSTYKRGFKHFGLIHIIVSSEAFWRLEGRETRLEIKSTLLEKI